MVQELSHRLRMSNQFARIKHSSMKQLIFLLLTLPFVSWGQNSLDYVTLSGKITDQNSDSLVVRTRTFSKTIQVHEDGTFRDTFQVNSGIYNLYDGNESTSVFLKNGFDIYLTLDTKEFDETINYSGTGSEHSNFLAKKALLEERLIDFDSLSEIDDQDSLDLALEQIGEQLRNFYASTPNIDSTVTGHAMHNLNAMLSTYKKFLGASIALKKELPKGSPSPWI